MFCQSGLSQLAQKYVFPRKSVTAIIEIGLTKEVCLNYVTKICFTKALCHCCTIELCLTI